LVFVEILNIFRNYIYLYYCDKFYTPYLPWWWSQKQKSPSKAEILGREGNEGYRNDDEDMGITHGDMGGDHGDGDVDDLSPRLGSGQPGGIFS
jgi:hypothetical protein